MTMTLSEAKSSRTDSCSVPLYPVVPVSDVQDASVTNVNLDPILRSTVEFLEARPSEVIVAAIEVLASTNASLVLRLQNSFLFKKDGDRQEPSTCGKPPPPPGAAPELDDLLEEAEKVLETMAPPCSEEQPNNSLKTTSKSSSQSTTISNQDGNSLKMSSKSSSEPPPIEKEGGGHTSVETSVVPHDDKQDGSHSFVSLASRTASAAPHMASHNAHCVKETDLPGRIDEARGHGSNNKVSEQSKVAPEGNVQEDTDGKAGSVKPPDPLPSPSAPDVRQSSKMTSASTAGGILQFSTNIYYAKEGEDNLMLIDVVRLGGSNQEVCSCHYATQDGTGISGKRYIGTSGVLEFGVGEIMKQISVPIINKDDWQATLEFKIVLTKPMNAMLGRYLHTCRVKVIDKDAFPTNKFKNEIRKNRYENISLFRLLIEYFKMNYHYTPIVQKGTLLILIFDQVQNLYFIWRLIVLKAVVDKVIGPECIGENEKVLLVLPCPENPENKDEYRSQQQVLLITLALLLILPHVIIHVLEYRKVFLKVGGISRKTLQANLVTKFLNYDESSRTQLAPSDLIMGMTRDTQEVVHDGYMQIFPLAMNLGRLAMMLALQVSIGAEFAAIPAIAIGLILGMWLGIRNKKSSTATNNMVKAQNDLLRYVSFVAQRYRLIIDYVKRPDAVRECETLIDEFNRKVVTQDAVVINNKIVASWLAVTSTGLWLLIGGMRVISADEEGGDPGGESLGVFLTNLEVFREVGEAWTEIYVVTLQLQMSLPYLQRIVQFMNLPIDLEKRMRLNRRRRTFGEEARKTLRKSIDATSEMGANTNPFAYAADLVPIKVSNVSFQHESPLQHVLSKENLRRSSANIDLEKILKESDQSLEKSIKEELERERKREGALVDCTFEFNQGTLIELVGLPGGGKSTLLKLIGGVLLPDCGDLLIPPHLRCLHISQDPILFNATLFDNLTYGLTKDDNVDGAPERVLEICKKLKVSEQVYQFIIPANEQLFNHKSDWDEVLSITQRALLNLARAFVANPELLVVHKPSLVFDSALTENTFTILREYVTERGLVMDPSMWPHRRPRTCVFTNTRSDGVMAADQAFTVTSSGILESGRAKHSTANTKFSS